MVDLEFQEFNFEFRGHDIGWPEALTLQNAIGVCRGHMITMDISYEEETALATAIDKHRAQIDAWYIAKYGQLPKYGS